MRMASDGPIPGSRSSSAADATSTSTIVSPTAGVLGVAIIVSALPPRLALVFFARRGDPRGPFCRKLSMAAMCASSPAVAGAAGVRDALHARSVRPHTRIAQHAPRARRSAGVAMCRRLSPATARTVTGSSPAASWHCRSLYRALGRAGRPRDPSGVQRQRTSA